MTRSALHLLAALVKKVIDVVPLKHEPLADIAQPIVDLFIGILLFGILLFKTIRTIVFILLRFLLFLALNQYPPLEKEMAKNIFKK